MKRAFLLILCLSMVLSLWSCRAQQPQAADVFYYPRTETAFSGDDGVFAPEERDLAAIRSDLSAVLALYCAGPVSSALANPLPPDTAVEDWSLEEGVLTLRFGAGLAQLSGVELTIAAGCLARTFLELTGAETLVLTADGALLNGETAMRLSVSDLSLRDDSLDRLHTDLTVYYASSDRRYLIGQDVSVQISSPEELPMQLLELLLSPPSGSGLSSPLPAGTRILSVSVADGLCTVELSPEFENRRFYSLTAQCLSLLSVVNTLTALESIDRVEFTIGGNLLIRYGSLDIAAPLVRDERCIGPVRTGLGETDAIVYLAHGDEGLLLPIPARLRQSAAASMPELVVRHLLQDPGTNGIRSCIPLGTQLNSVEVNGGTCYVDLSAEYLTAPEHLRPAGRVIAASLCQLEEVERVQILVNGAVPAEYEETWFGVLTPNEDWFL